MKTLKNGEPKYMNEILNETLYHTRRKPLIGKFYNNAKGKVSKQSIHNRLDFMAIITDNWLDYQLTDDSLMRLLMKTFLDAWNCQYKI